jgi:hypothetical protein
VNLVSLILSFIIPPVNESKMRGQQHLFTSSLRRTGGGGCGFFGVGGGLGGLCSCSSLLYRTLSVLLILVAFAGRTVKMDGGGMMMAPRAEG